ncbi:MAG TPA: trigger factor [Dehalococcoidia bacterium]|nr:trigger factor [Dehalococcoidia bacterium]
MKVTTEELPERQVKLQIEVDDERHNEAIEKAYRKLAPRVQIPGFRAGKAPRPLIEKQLGRHRLLDEAMDIVIPDVYREALEENAITPVAQPTVELVSHEPLVFTATVPLEPIVDLGDYNALRVPREAVTIEDKQVDDAVEDLRKRNGTIEPVNRKAKKGDIISGSVNAKAGDLSIFAADDIEFRVTDESLQSLPGFIDVVVGLKKGDEVTKNVEAPADHSDENIAGKTMTYVVKVNEVKEEKLAKLDDDFAKMVGDYETLLALRAKIREDIEKAETEANLRAYETAAVDALAEQAKIDYPAVMVEHEIDHILHDQANLDPRDPRAQLLYLQRMNKSEEEVRESVREEATTRLKRSLVLSQFAEAENINVEDADVDAELESMAASAGEQGDFVRQLFGGQEARETLGRNLHTRKTLERLVEIAGQEAKKAAAAKKPAKPRRTAPRKEEA